MKFKAVRDSLGIQAGGIYYGAIVVFNKEGISEPQGANALMIAVYNDNGKLLSYHPSVFLPYVG